MWYSYIRKAKGVIKMEKTTITLTKNSNLNTVKEIIAGVVANRVNEMAAVVNEEDMEDLINEYTVADLIKLTGGAPIKSKVVAAIENSNKRLSEDLIATMVSQELNISLEKAQLVTNRTLQENSGETRQNQFYEAMELVSFINKYQSL